MKHTAVNIGIEEAAGFGRLRGPRVGNRFALAPISLALEEGDATDVHRRLRGNADAGRTEAIVADDPGLGRPRGSFGADAFVGEVEPRTSGIAA